VDQEPTLAHRPNDYAEFVLGTVFCHHGGRTITAADAILFATQTHQAQAGRLDAEYARAVGFAAPPVSELLTFSIVLGLSVADLSESGGPFLGADRIEFPRPTFVGDTLYATSSVLERRPSGSRPGWGVVRWRTIGSNQVGEEVLSYERASLVRRAGGET
jgi:itaconyl-CoA hydratase